MSSLRDQIEDTVFARLGQSAATERLVDELSAIIQPEPDPADLPASPTPGSSLREQMVEVLLGSWSVGDDAPSRQIARQAAERDVDTLLGVVRPELAAREVAIRESAAAYAGLEVRYNAATAMAGVGKRHLERLHAVRAFRGRWAADTLTPQTAGFLEALGVVLDQAADQYCPRCGETASFWHNELCPRCERELPGEVIDGLRQSLEEQGERAEQAEAAIKRVRKLVAEVRAERRSLTPLVHVDHVVAALDRQETA